MKTLQSTCLLQTSG